MNNLHSPVIYCNQEMELPCVAEFMGGCVGVYTSRCPGKESPNEDSAAIIPFNESAGVLIVADGMGGHADGDVASRTAITEMVAAIKESRDTQSLLRTGIINGFERANEAVIALGTGAGTTLAVVEISDGMARSYHTGDSVILIFSSHGTVKLETTSHSPVGLGLEAGFLDVEEAASHEDRHFVLNAIGTVDMRIEIGSAVKLAKRDTVLIASDGLSDNLSMADVVGLVRSGHLEQSLNKLVVQCRQRMITQHANSKPDDLAVIIYRPQGHISVR